MVRLEIEGITHKSIAGAKCALLRPSGDGGLTLDSTREKSPISVSEPYEEKTLGRINEMLYPLTRICNYR